MLLCLKLKMEKVPTENKNIKIFCACPFLNISKTTDPLHLKHGCRLRIISSMARKKCVGLDRQRRQNLRHKVGEWHFRANWKCSIILRTSFNTFPESRGKSLEVSLQYRCPQFVTCVIKHTLQDVSPVIFIRILSLNAFHRIHFRGIQVQHEKQLPQSFRRNASKGHVSQKLPSTKSGKKWKAFYYRYDMQIVTSSW